MVPGTGLASGVRVPSPQSMKHWCDWPVSASLKLKVSETALPGRATVSHAQSGELLVMLSMIGSRVARAPAGGMVTDVWASASPPSSSVSVRRPFLQHRRQLHRHRDRPAVDCAEKSTG
jgi:hypothetical protein